MFYGGKYDAQNRYDEWNTTQIKLKLNNKTDQDILSWIKNHKYARESSVQGAIKALIREDIARQKSLLNAAARPGFHERPEVQKAIP